MTRLPPQVGTSRSIPTCAASQPPRSAWVHAQPAKPTIHRNVKQGPFGGLVAASSICDSQVFVFCRPRASSASSLSSSNSRCRDNAVPAHRMAHSSCHSSPTPRNRSSTAPTPRTRIRHVAVLHRVDDRADGPSLDLPRRRSPPETAVQG